MGFKPDILDMDVMEEVLMVNSNLLLLLFECQNGILVLVIITTKTMKLHCVGIVLSLSIWLNVIHCRFPAKNQ